MHGTTLHRLPTRAVPFFPAKAKKMKKILLVDDSPSVRQQVRLALTEGGYVVVEGNDGLDGLAKLAATPDVGLIISDINMPRMNGLDMIEKVKSDPKNA